MFGTKYFWNSHFLVEVMLHMKKLSQYKWLSLLSGAKTFWKMYSLTEFSRKSYLCCGLYNQETVTEICTVEPWCKLYIVQFILGHESPQNLTRQHFLYCSLITTEKRTWSELAWQCSKHNDENTEQSTEIAIFVSWVTDMRMKWRLCGPTGSAFQHFAKPTKEICCLTVAAGGWQLRVGTINSPRVTSWISNGKTHNML